jgi:hypothetical protein
VVAEANKIRLPLRVKSRRFQEAPPTLTPAIRACAIESVEPVRFELRGASFGTL